MTELTDRAAGKAGGRASGALAGHLAMFAFAALVAASYSIGALARRWSRRRR